MVKEIHEGLSQLFFSLFRVGIIAQYGLYEKNI